MDMTNCIMWFTMALVFITVVVTKVSKGRIMFDPKCNRPLLPAVTGVSMIRALHTLFKKGLQGMIHDQYTKLGSVFTISFFGLKVTFLIGPEVSGHFYQALESEIGNDIAYGFSVAMFGKEVGFGVDSATQNEQTRFYDDAIKPSKLGRHVGSMLQEVEDYFAKWGQQGMVDMKHELKKLVMLISGRCLLGKEIRETMFDEFFTLFYEFSDNSMCLTNVLFPYAPTLENRRCDKARAKLEDMCTEIVRARKNHNHVENDLLQNLTDSKYRDGRCTTEAEVVGLIMILLFAGMHTSSASSLWTGAHLLTSVRSLASALDEQRKILKKYVDHLDYSALLEMDTLHRCIKEALRINPPGTMLIRQVHKNFTVQTKEGNEYEIHTGHTVISLVQFNNSLVHIYKEPNVYDPDRFGPGRQEDIVGGKFSYLIFGGGRHPCIGESYAYLQIKVIWSYLLRNFELKLESPWPEADYTKIVPEAKGRVMVSYKKRLLPTTQVVCVCITFIVHVLWSDDALVTYKCFYGNIRNPETTSLNQETRNMEQQTRKEYDVNTSCHV